MAKTLEFAANPDTRGDRRKDQSLLGSRTYRGRGYLASSAPVTEHFVTIRITERAHSP
jgi:hypothetical protein